MHRVLLFFLHKNAYAHAVRSKIWFRCQFVCHDASITYNVFNIEQCILQERKPIIFGGTCIIIIAAQKETQRKRGAYAHPMYAAACYWHNQSQKLNQPSMPIGTHRWTSVNTIDDLGVCVRFYFHGRMASVAAGHLICFLYGVRK